MMSEICIECFSFCHYGSGRYVNRVLADNGFICGVCIDGGDDEQYNVQLEVCEALLVLIHSDNIDMPPKFLHIMVEDAMRIWSGLLLHDQEVFQSEYPRFFEGVEEE